MNDDEDRQEEALAFLADSASHGGAMVERIDTHATWVFLAGAGSFSLQRQRPDSRVWGRVPDASDAGPAVAQAQENYRVGALNWAPIDASGTIEATTARARAALD